MSPATDKPTFAIRVKDRGLVTHVNDEPLTSYEQAEKALTFIRDALLEDGEIERLILFQEGESS